MIHDSIRAIVARSCWRPLLGLLAVYLGFAGIACATGAASSAALSSSQSPSGAGRASQAQSTALPTREVAFQARVAPPVATKPAAQATLASGVAGERAIILATTTSTQDSGLLDVLVPMFERQSGWRVKTISVGTGAALALGARGEVDVVLVHAPEAERKWLAEGNGTERLLVMHNDFVVVGPPDDAAGIRGERSVVTALQRVAERRAIWVSRDDSSGTDQLERALWRSAELSPKGSSWYLVTGQGMGATLTLADQKNAYTLTDRGTFLARRAAHRSQIMVEGDRPLLNVYHVMPVNPAKFPGVPVDHEGGRAFAAFLVGPDAQRAISEYGRDRYGQALYVPDAGRTEEQVGR